MDKARHRSLSGARATACLKARPKGPFRVISPVGIREHGQKVCKHRGVRGANVRLL